MITDAMLTDADIDTMRERMAARSPLSAIAHDVWGAADAHSVWDDPAGHEELICELVDPIRAWITSAAGNGGAPWDDRLLTKMARLVAKVR
jgi:hypothetical protein